MSDEQNAYSPQPTRESTIVRRLLGAIPPRPEEVEEGVGAAAASDAVKRSEARRDAIIAVSLAVVRRGQNPVRDWSTKDSDAVYAIADILISLD